MHAPSSHRHSKAFHLLAILRTIAKPSVVDFKYENGLSFYDQLVDIVKLAELGHSRVFELKLIELNIHFSKAQKRYWAFSRSSSSFVILHKLKGFLTIHQTQYSKP